MAYQGPPMYGQPQAPPQYGQSQNYPTGPVADGTKYGLDQGPPPAYNYTQPGVPMPVSAYGNYPGAAAGPGAPVKHGYGQGCGPDYGRPPPPPAVRVAVPSAFERHSESGRPTSGGSQPQGQPGHFTPTDFNDYPPRDSSTALNNYSYSSSFSDKAIRRAFIRKVYLILTTQLLVTLGFIALFIFVEPVKNWVRREGMWCYIVAYVTFLITYIMLVCCPSVRRNYPGNFICLGIFTVAFSYLTATISSFHDTKIVLLAAGITGAVCLAISLFAIQTKVDFTLCSGLLFALVMVLFFFGWACMITYYCWGYNHIMDTVYAGLGALVFALFLVYDTQMIIGGRKHEMSPEEYIYGALQLYIDVVYIFLFLLSLMGKNK
ncbi:hypothetical protein ACOMHN_000778 [Nucella lapillus]